MKINIGVSQYEMSLQNGDCEDFYSGLAEEDKDALISGYTHPVYLVIKINNDISSQAKMQTFWHEVVHAMLYEIGATDLNYDEGFVDAFSKQLYGFFKTNKLDKIYEKLK